jgi:hypothetical protein
MALPRPAEAPVTTTVSLFTAQSSIANFTVIASRQIVISNLKESNNTPAGAIGLLLDR